MSEYNNSAVEEIKRKCDELYRNLSFPYTVDDVERIDKQLLGMVREEAKKGNLRSLEDREAVHNYLNDAYMNARKHVVRTEKGYHDRF